MQEKVSQENNNQPLISQLLNVCGRVITNDPVYHYPTQYQGRTIYFCTEFCLEAFLADPDRFYIAHSTRKS